MKGKRNPLYRALVVTAAAVLMLQMGCDSVTPPNSGVPEVDFCINCTPGNASFEASGGIVDEGTVDGKPIDVNAQEFHGYRVMQGKKGLVYIAVHAYRSPYTHSNPKVFEGSFEIRGGTDRYEGIEGNGTFEFRRSSAGLVETFRGCSNGQH